MSFEVSLRARILADLLERRRIRVEAQALRKQLKALTDLRRAYAADVIAERHQTKVRRVNAIAASVCWEIHHTDEE